MSENRSVLALRDGQLRWLRPGMEPTGLESVADRSALLAELSRRQHNVVFAAPGGDLRLLEIDVPAEERRHLDTSLPYRLEDSFTDDIEALHFARRMHERDRCVVAAVAHASMEAWHEELAEFADLLPWVPEPLLLPRQDGEWMLVLEGDSALLRWGAYAGSRIELSLLPMLLDGLAAQGVPERLIVYGLDEAGSLACLPEELRDVAEWRRGDLSAALWLADEEAALDLLQGNYAPRLPYTRWWSQWRSVAALVGVALVLHIASGWLDLRRLERENESLRREIEAVYRGVNPRGNLVDAERQLRQQLAGLRGDTGGSTFSAALAPLATGVAEQDGVQLANLTYSQARSELRLNLLAPDFNAVEELRTGLATQGLGATLESSSRSGDSVRARLRLEAAR
ncbi:MAG: type II secretion system protein GspL [Pseudomonadota bacterium]